MSYHLDWEVFSESDLTEVGGYRYAEDASTELLMGSISTDNEGPYLWVHPKHRSAMLNMSKGDHRRADELMERMAKDEDEDIWAHNAPFEAACIRSRWKKDGLPGPRPALHRMRCTAAVARSAGLPSALGMVAALILNREQQKVDDGKRLIKIFCMPQKDGKRIMPADRPNAFAKLGAYCLQDNEAERALTAKLRPFIFQGALLDAWMMDLALNDRGFPLNVPALENALKLIQEASVDLVARFRKRTGGLNPTQRAKTKQWLEDHGCTMPNMQADTVQDTLDGDDLNDKCRTVLHLYSLIQYSAVAKVKTMLACVCRDGWARGMLKFYGAGTGRWSGSLIQPQNMRKSTIGKTHLAYQMICEGCTLKQLTLVFGNPLEAIASCIRNFIQWSEGDMFDVDYSAIEARIVNWLAGQEDALEAYRRKEDQYIAMASVIYGKHRSKITKDEREVGKRAVLGCGFSMAGPKFKKTCWDQYRIKVSQELADKAVAAYRATHKKVQQLWYRVDDAARMAIAKPGTVFAVGQHLKLWVHTYSGVPYLLMRLPSGRKLAYPWPKLEHNPDRERDDVTFYGQIKGQHWGRVKTYGGKLVENATQATAFDLMANGAVNAENDGFQIVTLIHDQAPALHLPGQKLDRYVAALTRLPEWAQGLPLAAEGRIVPFYTKG